PDRLYFMSTSSAHSSVPLFPYTTLFRSELVLPGGVRVINIEPRQANGQAATVKLTVGALSEAAKQGFLEALERSDAFSHVELTKDRKSTRLNSSHQIISYAVFCLKKNRY